MEPGRCICVYVKKKGNFKFGFDEGRGVMMIGGGRGVGRFRCYLEAGEELDL
ncbi:hypothetical protein [Staphylococcus cohnii]|uniref:hypothetical protein n=1 Tax=Staphylococcus cohnii TaxID=29382 RepID=UPI0016430E15|nr:hypothetical protein [Staphylococcus cohnii]